MANENLSELKAALASAKAAYLAEPSSAAHAEVKASLAALSAAITEGASPCPSCGRPPHGIEQPGPRGRSTYEVGCLACRPLEHTDGTRRAHRVRGGLLPRHAVEAWNAGPDQWEIAK